MNISIHTMYAICYLTFTLVFGLSLAYLDTAQERQPRYIDCKEYSAETWCHDTVTGKFVEVR